MREILPCVECVDLGFSKPISSDEQQAFDAGDITACPGRSRREMLYDVQVLDGNDRVVTLTSASALVESDVCPKGISAICLEERLMRSLRTKQNISS